MSTKDYVEANNPAIFMHLQEKNLVPKYVLESQRVTEEETDSLNVAAFADPYNRAYPCHTKAACWQSAAWYAGTQSNEPHIKTAIEKLAAVHGISEDVKNVFDCFEQEAIKSAGAAEITPQEQRFALSLNFNGYDGRGFEQHYPINTAQEVLASCTDADNDYRSGIIPMPVMRKIATTLLQAAKEFDVDKEDLPGTVVRYGEQRLPDPFCARALIGVRKKANVDIKPYEDAVEQLCTVITKTAGVEDAIARANAVAEELYDLDCDNNIRYSKMMPDPYNLIFSGPFVDALEKAAASVVEILNVDVPVVDFLNMPDTKIDDMFSKKAAVSIKLAKQAVQGEPSIEKTAAASQILSTLSPDVNKALLAVLASTTW